MSRIINGISARIFKNICTSGLDFYIFINLSFRFQSSPELTRLIADIDHVLNVTLIRTEKYSLISVGFWSFNLTEVRANSSPPSRIVSPAWGCPPPWRVSPSPPPSPGGGPGPRVENSRSEIHIKTQWWVGRHWKNLLCWDHYHADALQCMEATSILMS